MTILSEKILKTILSDVMSQAVDEFVEEVKASECPSVPRILSGWGLDTDDDDDDQFMTGRWLEPLALPDGIWEHWGFVDLPTRSIILLDELCLQAKAGFEFPIATRRYLNKRRGGRWSRSALDYALKRLKQAGLLRVEKEGSGARPTFFKLTFNVETGEVDGN